MKSISLGWTTGFNLTPTALSLMSFIRVAQNTLQVWLSATNSAHLWGVRHKISAEPWIMFVCQGAPRKYDIFKQALPFLHIWYNLDRLQFLKRKWKWLLVGWYYRWGSCGNSAICPILFPCPERDLVAHLGSYLFPWLLSSGILFLSFKDLHLSINTVTMFLWAIANGEYKMAESYEMKMILMFLLPLHDICHSVKVLPHSVHGLLH